MARDIKDLEKNALKFWPTEISQLERDSSIIPRLIETQDKFISILNIANSSPFAWKKVLEVTKEITPNLFLKHLMVLSDIGGEMMMRFKKELPLILKDNKITFSWDGKPFEYEFQTLNGKKNWDNKSLSVDGKSLSQKVEINPLIEDACNLILFGGGTINDDLPQDIEYKCVIGNLIGKDDELQSFVKQRYIWVSRITGGAQANSLGYIAQNYVINYLKTRLKTWDFSGKDIPGITQNGKTTTKFDIVAKSPKSRYCAIELSFQVTTNSTIERKAGQAKSRLEVLHKKGHKIAYIIDGSGNFFRVAALQTICNFSDFTVSFSKSELEKFCEFLESLDKK